MEFISWEDGLSVGVAEIDAQHQELIRLINKLHTAMKTREAKEVLGEIIQGLVDYAVTHFAVEEKYFDLCD